MTIKEGTVCSLIQSFPILLILAQNHNKCLKTPFVYKPPTPTHSPEYYEALDALFQTLYGHGYPGHVDEHHGCDHVSYGIKRPWGSPCYNSFPTVGQGHQINGYGYPSYGSGHNGYQHTGYPAMNSYGYRKVSLYNVTGYKGEYAPNQVYNVNHKYKIVVKKNSRKRRPHRRPEKIQVFNGGSGFPSINREERRFGNQFSGNNFHNTQVIPSRVTSILHLQQEDHNYNSEFVYPFNRPNNYRDQSPYYSNQPYQSGGFSGYRPEYQHERYPYNNYPDSRPQWNQNQQNAGRDPIIVVAEEITEPQKAAEGNSFEDRYSEDTSNNPEVTVLPKTEEFNNDNGDQKAGIPSAPPAEASPSDGLSPETPATTLPALTPVPHSDTRSNFNFGTQGLFKDSCNIPEGGLGSCVSLLECAPYLSQLKTARANPEVVQRLRKAHCGFEGDNPKVCCPRRALPTNTPAPPVEEPKTPKPETTTEAPETTIAPVETSSDQYVDALPQPPVCGSSNASFSRVVGGIPAKLGDFPWMALLGYRNAKQRDKVQFLCGGSVITQKHILTAAHCYHTDFKVLALVRLGELDLGREDDGAHPIDINIKKVIEHEEFNPTSFVNDIAILLLEQLIPFSDLIKPICLPNSMELRSLTFEKYTPLIAGWGELQWHGERSNILQVVQLPVTSNEYCKKAFEAYKAQRIDERVLCAGYEKGVKDACRGDSGGPLMQPIWNPVTYNTFFYQIGVVSFGKKCAEPGFPGVYTRITTFMPWIEKTVLGHSL